MESPSLKGKSISVEAKDRKWKAKGISHSRKSDACRLEHEESSIWKITTTQKVGEFKNFVKNKLKL